MAQNLLINGSVFNGVESINMVNANGEQVTYVEKVNAGTGVPVAKISEREFYTVEDALAGAVAGDTVTMIADSTENVNLIIPHGVTLHIQGFTLTVGGVVGLDGSKLTAATDTNKNDSRIEGGKLVTAKGSLILDKEGYIDSATGYYTLPVWYPAQNCYVFSLFNVNTSASAYGLYINEETKTLTFRFKHQATNDVNVLLLSDGASDNELSVVVHFEWMAGAGSAYLDFAFTDEQVGQVAGTYRYTYTLNGYDTLLINMDTLKVSGRVITASGAMAESPIWTIDMAKQE